jgi:hypothetical protein
MTKAELDKKPLAELHTLAADAGVERYRMLPRPELIAKLAGDAGGSSGDRPSPPSGERGEGGRGEGARRERPPRRRRSGQRGGGRDGGSSGARERAARADAEEAPEPATQAQPEPPRRPEPDSPEQASASESSSRPRRRRRRRFGRRGKQEVTLQGLLLPAAGRQAVLAAESRQACTELLRGIAADLSDGSKGPDPVALLIDPTPEELADWRRDAPAAEIVAAGQPRHASDALAQAATRAGNGEDVILLVDSLTRLGEAYGDAEAAKTFFDAGRTATGTGSLTVVAALERS